MNKLIRVALMVALTIPATLAAQSGADTATAADTVQATISIPAAGAPAGFIDGAALPAPGPPELRPGDMIRIAVWRQPELSGEFRVGPDGSILHPLYNDVDVAGVPLDVMERRLREFLSHYESNPRFSAEPLFRVAVGGEVQRPDLYTLPPRTTIAQALALAGGPSDEAELERVRLIRGGREYRVDLTVPQAGLAARMIRSGDQIIVPLETSFFREYIVPALSVVSAIGTVGLLIIRLRRE